MFPAGRWGPHGAGGNGGATSCTGWQRVDVPGGLEAADPPPALRQHRAVGLEGLSSHLPLCSSPPGAHAAQEAHPRPAGGSSLTERRIYFA